MHMCAVIAAATMFVAVPALAQSNSTTPPAVANPKDVNKTTAAPVAGKNSFTEGEAKNRLEANGYTQVSALKKDDQSIWRGEAMKSGASVKVAVDYQGNITQD
jgi:hypothetical protein